MPSLVTRGSSSPTGRETAHLGMRSGWIRSHRTLMDHRACGPVDRNRNRSRYLAHPPAMWTAACDPQPVPAHLLAWAPVTPDGPQPFLTHSTPASPNQLGSGGDRINPACDQRPADQRRQTASTFHLIIHALAFRAENATARVFGVMLHYDRINLVARDRFAMAIPWDQMIPSVVPGVKDDVDPRSRRSRTAQRSQRTAFGTGRFARLER